MARPLLTILPATAAVLAVALAIATPASATWSIAAIDHDTGTVGVAVASCVAVPVDDVIALVPNNGAAVAQGLFDPDARAAMLDALSYGESSPNVVRAGQKAAESPSQVQLGAVTANSPADTYTGNDTTEWSGDANVNDAAIQGNILVDRGVVGDARAAWTDTDSPFSDRLMAALEAGSAAGGDKRCNVDDIEQTAASAAIMVATPEDEDWLHLSVTNTEDRRNAVAMLAEKYDSWRETSELDGTRPTADVPKGDKSATPVVRTVWQMRIERALKAFVIIFPLSLLAFGLWWWLDRRRSSDPMPKPEDPTGN
jgi:uncharacterized Ntn-hydrolase superfamily protein